MNFFKQLPLYFAIVLLAFISIGAEKVYKPDFIFRHKFAYTVDGAGIFIYDMQTHIDRKIFNTDRSFVSNSLKTENDSEISFTLRTVIEEYDIQKLAKLDTIKNYVLKSEPKIDLRNLRIVVGSKEDTTIIGVYVDTTYTINIQTGQYYVSTVCLNQERIFNTTITTTQYDRFGKQTDHQVIPHQPRYINSKSSKYTYINEIGDNKAFALDRRIFYTNSKDTIQVAKVKNDFIRFNGLSLSRDIKKIIYSFTEFGFSMHYRLYEYDIESKKKKLISKEFYENLHYSFDHKLVLMRNYHKQHTDRKPLYSIYVLDPSTKQKRNLCTGNDYVWIE